VHCEVTEKGPIIAIVLQRLSYICDLAFFGVGRIEMKDSAKDFYSRKV